GAGQLAPAIDALVADRSRFGAFTAARLSRHIGGLLPSRMGYLYPQAPARWEFQTGGRGLRQFDEVRPLAAYSWSIDQGALQINYDPGQVTDELLFREQFLPLIQDPIQRQAADEATAD